MSGGFSKLMIMVPVMLAARKIDSEDPKTIYWLRLAYGSIQSVCVLIVLYTYVRASALKGTSDANKGVVYVPAQPTVSATWWRPAGRGLSPFCEMVEISPNWFVLGGPFPVTHPRVSPIRVCSVPCRCWFVPCGITAQRRVIWTPSKPPWQPFADPNAKKKYTEVRYSAHILSTARSLVGSTLFGVVMTVGLHWYKGMAMGLAIQTVMGPLNLFENPIVKALLIGNGFKPEDRIFEEKTAEELTPEDEVVDESGNAVVPQLGAGGGASPAAAGASGTTFQELLLDTWDAGNKADVSTLMGAVTKKNCNFRTKENGWTPLMILAGLNAKGTASAIRQVKELGGNPAIVDAEGWNALHWAAFHGSIDAAKELVKDAGLLSTKDKEGKVPLDMAKLEGNDDVAKFLESVTVGDGSTSSGNKTDGVRKRK